MKEEQEKILIIDFMYLWNRIYYATQNQETNYYEHMLSIIEKVHRNTVYIKKYIVLDGENSICRQKELLPEYKEGRAPKKEVYARINQFVKECAEKYADLQFVRANGYEADEVIACFSYIFSQKGKQVLIYSGDKDLLQLLVYPNVYVGIKYTRLFELQPFTDEEIQKKMDIISNKTLSKVGDILKFRIFRGDTSDSIPAAIPRFPSKTILNIIENTWAGVTPLSARVVNNMEEFLQGKDKEKFRENIPNLYRNWELMQLQFLPREEIMKKVKRLT